MEYKKFKLPRNTIIRDRRFPFHFFYLPKDRAKIAVGSTVSVIPVKYGGFNVAVKLSKAVRIAIEPSMEFSLDGSEALKEKPDLKGVSDIFSAMVDIFGGTTAEPTTKPTVTWTTFGWSPEA